ncbi:hypothetical protein AKO1_006659 [Acrasis kona]|uniref:AB hydrolase-1 domain-containing protein n=1 Tax=Acrasis kona TaxID=1008807 RepID=A0AAW2ZN60_9EUKA
MANVPSRKVLVPVIGQQHSATAHRRITTRFGEAFLLYLIIEQQVYGTVHGPTKITTCFQPTSIQSKSRGVVLLIHGFGAGSAVWTKDIDLLCEQFEKIYTIDLIGFARSNKEDGVPSLVDPEELFIDSIETWRSFLDIKSLTIVGHSFGGFLASLYCIKHMDRVEKLCLASPIGLIPAFDRKKASTFETMWIELGRIFYEYGITLNSVLRAAGPLSTYLVRLHGKWRFVNGTKLLSKYIHAVNILKHNSISLRTEKAIFSMLLPGAFAKHPLSERVVTTHRKVISDLVKRTTVLYGENDWMDYREMKQLNVILRRITGNVVPISFVKNSGHQLFWDNPEGFVETMMTGLDR